VQELLRVDSGLDCRPKYRHIYWNCRDICVRFAFLATEHYASLALAQTLSRLFESAKFEFQKGANFWSSNAIWSVANISVDLLHTLGETAYPLLGAARFYEKLSQHVNMTAQKEKLIYEALMDRERWVGVLEQRFPQLRGLSMGQDQWENCADSVSIIALLKRRGWYP
jgi:hypothetical protein